jgi:acetyl esterase
MMAASGRPKLWELTPVEARKMALELAQMVDAKEAIGKSENGTLPGPPGPLSFRTYTPVAPAAEPLAGIVYFHGGAWVFGDLDTHDGVCRMLAMRAAAVSYRSPTAWHRSTSSPLPFTKCLACLRSSAHSSSVARAKSLR